jgi:succinoglycan biosynthesis transport protein ExoP
MLHDLNNPAQAFRTPSKILLQLNKGARTHAVKVYTDSYNNREGLSLFNKDQYGLNELIISMKYDNTSLLKTLAIYRAENSDFINVEYTDDNPQLTAFVVNTLAHEFITYYDFILKDNQQKAITLLRTLVAAKKDTLDSAILKLKNYRIRNRILSLPEQSGAIYSQLGDLEKHLEDAQQNAVANKAAMQNIDDHFKPGEEKYLEKMMVPVNQSLINNEDELKVVEQEYVESNFKDIYRRQRDSLQNLIKANIERSSDQNIVSPLSSQQALVTQRLTLETAYQIAKNSVGTIQNQISNLNAQLASVVPNEAVVQQEESAIEIATKEYLDILSKYNQASYNENLFGQLKQIETAMPGSVTPSKKLLIVILSGFISFVFCIIVFFILYFFDESIQTPEDLANKTGVPVLGYLNLLSTSTIDLRKVWNDPHPDAEIYHFRNLLQSIRFEVDTELGPNKVLVINSLANREGKTFAATNLAYAYSLVNKKVLLVDGNFYNPGVTRSVKSKMYLEEYFNGLLPDFTSYNLPKITVLSNKGGDGSLFEISTEGNIKEKFEKLKDVFDIIIIEASSLNTLNKSKEWNKFADKILTIFEAGKNLRSHEKKHISYLKNQNGKFMGWVLNVVNKHDAADEDHSDDNK